MKCIPAALQDSVRAAVIYHAAQAMGDLMRLLAVSNHFYSLRWLGLH